MANSQHINFAIAYDFDGTLSNHNMQEYDFIPKLGLTPKEFWKEAEELSKKHNADPILAYMFLMLKKAKAADLPIRRDDFVNDGRSITLFPGVDTWFERINRYGEQLNITVEHYIISSGIKEIIEGSSIFTKFKQVFASSFMYDANGVACWPSRAINYTTKTQYLFRINKGAFDESENRMVNEYIPDEDRNIPFNRMVFIGDGSTDIPCFRVMRNLGGYSIAVYDDNIPGAKERVKKICANGKRSSLIFKTDYSENSPIELAVKAILNKSRAEEELLQLQKETRAEFGIEEQ
ncbi:MAG: haloacid dehalogenase-like hydrolase [Ruminobacter sp.]|jgi:phosphoserine phosphatase|nr:haloacid dehalogenase-like hydrolase [Ruminobacter sp.]